MTLLSSPRYSSLWYVSADACLLLLCYQEGGHFRKTRMTQSVPLCTPHTDSQAHWHANDEDCEMICCAIAARSSIFLCITTEFITKLTFVSCNSSSKKHYFLKFHICSFCFIISNRYLLCILLGYVRADLILLKPRRQQKWAIVCLKWQTLM